MKVRHFASSPLVLTLILAGAAQGATPTSDAAPKPEASLPAPTGQTAVGMVSGRQGTYLVIALVKGAAVKPGDALIVSRPRLVVSIALPKERQELWGNWQEIGRLTVRALQSTGYCIAFITQESQPAGPETTPAPPIRPGDIVCLLPAGPPSGVPPAKGEAPTKAATPQP
jgi:hypothetical protein